LLSVAGAGSLEVFLDLPDEHTMGFKLLQAISQNISHGI
jgi:hypothetical protein